MRDIKFRGRRVENGEWVYGYYWRDNMSGKQKITVDLSDDNFTCFVIDIATLGQYTGLKDKNGKEIYEGDIYRTIGAGDRYFAVFYKQGAFCGGSDSDHCSVLAWSSDEIPDEDGTNWLEVIGNIYEHAELLA